MSDSDKLILTIYFIVVTLILYQTINSQGEQITVKFDKKNVEDQLGERDLDGSIDIKFILKNQYDINDFKHLEIEIKNNFSEGDIYVDWERSCWVDMGGRSGRMVRLLPSMNLNLFQDQVRSPIPAGKMLKEKVTAEQVLQKDDSGGFKLSFPLVTVNQIKSKPAKQGNGKSSLILKLVLRLFDTSTDDVAGRVVAIYCPLIVTRLDWIAALPWVARK